MIWTPALSRTMAVEPFLPRQYVAASTAIIIQNDACDRSIHVALWFEGDQSHRHERHNRQSHRLHRIPSRGQARSSLDLATTPYALTLSYVEMQQRLAEFERLLIRALLGLGDNGYAMTIRRESERVARRRVTLGSACWVLDPPEERGLVSSYHCNPTASRGGRPR